VQALANSGAGFKCYLWLIIETTNHKRISPRRRLSGAEARKEIAVGLLPL